MRRVELLEALATIREGAAMVISPGLSNYHIAPKGDHPLTIYNMEMPYATPLALGVALAWPAKKVVAIEGDGSLLAGPGVLSTIGHYRPQNLVVLVCDNGVYLTTGTGTAPTTTGHGTDIEGLARASGINNIRTVSDLEEATDVLQQALSEDGPWIIVAKVDRSDQGQRGSLPTTVLESGFRFRRAALDEPSKP